MCVWSHVIMVLLDILKTLLNMKGRYNNKVKHEVEKANTWLLLSQYVDMIAAMFYLLFSLHLSYNFQGIQICMYNLYMTSDSCYNNFSLALVYIIYDLNGYISYCAGISFYILEKMISGSIHNKQVSDA